LTKLIDKAYPATMNGRKDKLVLLFQTTTRHHYTPRRSCDYCNNRPSNYYSSWTNIKRQRVATATTAATTTIGSVLPPPTILFSNHHLLVVDKPAGWHSIPLDDDHNNNMSSSNHYETKTYSVNNNSKCLLSFLRRHQLGGGGNRRYLKPVHRLDQPCTGVVVMAKNTKAASRVQRAFAQRQVHKEYLCIVQGNNIHSDLLWHRSWSQKQFHDMRKDISSDVVVVQQKKNEQAPGYWGSVGLWDDNENVRVLAGLLRKRADGKGSVHVTAINDKHSHQFQKKPPELHVGEDDANHMSRTRDAKFCFLEYRHVCTVPRNNRKDHRNQASPLYTDRPDPFHDDNAYWHLLAVRTHTGMRHQIRSLLSQVGGCPIVGDLRYGGGHHHDDNDNDSTTMAVSLPDQSVALHARTIYLPTVQLGGTDLISQPFVAKSKSYGTWKYSEMGRPCGGNQPNLIDFPIRILSSSLKRPLPV
jgi:23S rRNA-/tRNA-specific pseudouridylate synthase